MEFNLLLADQIGAHLKSLRKLRGLSQAQLGQRLGVGQARVAAIEADPGAVSVEQLLRVFQVLGVDLVARVKPDPVKLTQAQAKPTPEAVPTWVAPPSVTTPKAATPLVIKKNKGQW